MNEPEPTPEPSGALDRERHWFWIEDEPYLHPTWGGTIAIILSMVVGYLFLDGPDSSAIAKQAGWFLLGGLAISALCDLRVSLKNLVRIDFLALVALFYLTFAEFVLADQPVFSETVFSFDAKRGILAAYLGFLGLALGRHLVRPGVGMPFEGDVGFPRNLFLLLVMGCFFLGNLYAFIAVSFNPFDWFYHQCGARFSQPWARGKYGSWSTLLGEFKIVLQVVPPLAGIIFARRRDFSPPALFITLIILLLTLFEGFAEGTRNVLALNLAGFLGGYLIVQKHIRIRPVVFSSIAIAAIFILFSHHQLKFRGIGLRVYYTSGMWKQELVPEVFKIFEQEDPFDKADGEFEGFFVDLNLRNIAGLTRVFPSTYPFLGLNMPYVALTKPIPRAIWPGKPEDFDTGIEEALAADQGYTLSCTFVGEAFMMWGYPGVFITGLFFGAVFMYWNRVGSRDDSVFQRLVFASLFYPALITMRSVITFSTAVLAALFLVAIGYFMLRHFSEDEPDLDADYP